jgi:hypothetical protein
MVEEIKLIDIGADPEFFLVKGDMYQSSEGIVGGTKQEPRSLGIPGYFVQEDNVSVEFNIPAARNEDELVSNINQALSLIKNIIPAGIEFCEDVSADFPEDQLQTEQAKLFGWKQPAIIVI